MPVPEMRPGCYPYCTATVTLLCVRTPPTLMTMGTLLPDAAVNGISTFT